MPFAATWMELETIILCEVSQKKTNTTWYHSYVESNYKNKDTDKHIYKTKTDLKISRTSLWLPKGKCVGRDKSGAWNEHTHTTMHMTDDKQGPTI